MQAKGSGRHGRENATNARGQNRLANPNDMHTIHCIKMILEHSAAQMVSIRQFHIWPWPTQTRVYVKPAKLRPRRMYMFTVASAVRRIHRQQETYIEHGAGYFG